MRRSISALSMFSGPWAVENGNCRVPAGTGRGLRVPRARRQASGKKLSSPGGQGIFPAGRPRVDDRAHSGALGGGPHRGGLKVQRLERS